MCTRKLMRKFNHELTTNQRVKLRPKTLRTHMTTEYGVGYTVDWMSFETGDSFKELVKKAILRIGKKNRKGQNIFRSAQVRPNETVDLLTSI